MRILVATRSLGPPGGSETYVATVVPHLRQLGHDVVAYSPIGGATADRLREAGVEVRHELADVGRPDVAHAQHASTTIRVRAHFPDLPLVYVGHSSVLDIEDPPPGAAAQATVALNDIVARRLSAGSGPPPVRLRQPVDVPFVDPETTPLPSRPRRALLMAHRAGSMVDLVRAACEAEGIALEVLGLDGRHDPDPGAAMRRTDVVFAVGRTLLEAMALGRAPFLLDDRGSGGFVTGDRYPVVEAGAFAVFDGQPTTVASLRRQLQEYRPELGREAGELVRRHHSARSHARDLVDTYRRAAECPGPVAPDIARLGLGYADALEARFALTFANHDAAWRAARAERHAAEQRAHADALQARLVRTEAALAAAQAEVDALHATRTMRWLAPLRRSWGRVRPVPTPDERKPTNEG